MAISSRPTFDSLRMRPKIGREALIFKEAQMPGAGGEMPPDIGMSPVTGNPDEMQAPESANQRQYEDDFGSLALQFVKDRAPALMPYMIGFEVVDRSEDGSKAVGIFGHKVGDDFYYVPVFFLNNQVRGVDMILNKKTNQFIPLTEKWIDFIVNKHAVSIGGPADDRVRDSMRSPDLSFVRSPQVGKMASAPEEPWTLRQAWQHIKEATAKAAETPEFKEAMIGLCMSVKGKVEKSAEAKTIKDFMEKVGGPEGMLSLIQAMHDVEFANAALTLYKDAESFCTENLVNAKFHVERMKKIAAEQPKVRIVDSAEHLSKTAQDTPAAAVDDEDKKLSDEENARQILEHDFTIEDSRPDDETARVSDEEVVVNFERNFNPPDGPGMYNFVMSDSETREGILLNTCVSDCDRNEALFLFEDGDGFIAAKASPMSCLTTEFSEDSKKDDAGEDLKKLYDNAKLISSIEVGESDAKDGKNYLFIDEKGNAAGPFNIRHVLVDGDHVRFSTGHLSSDVVFHTSAPEGLETEYGFMDWNMEDRFHNKSGRKTPECCDCCCESPCECYYGDFISLGSSKGMPKKTPAGVIIPDGWKAIEIKVVPRYAPWRDGEKNEEHEARNAKVKAVRAEYESKYRFGTPYEIMESLSSEGTQRIKIASDGTEFSIKVDGAKRRHGPLNYKQASVDLVTRFGMRPRRAFGVLAKAASAGSVRLLVSVPSLRPRTEKQAQDGLVNVAMPSPADQMPGIDPYTGVPVYASPYVDLVRGSFTGVPGLPPEGGMTRGINMGGEMARGMGGGDYPDEHTDSFKDALPLDQEARRLAEEAAAAGQRHVFDQAAIGGLVKVYDVANVVDSYIPEFMDTLDRLGRVLFLFYWKHEDFNQRYGSDDVVQMEDRLRNVFKSLGELALQLKEKAVQKE